MTVVYILLVLVLLLVLFAALLPGKYNVEKSIIIKKPVPAVMDKVGDLNYFAKWNPWQLMEKSGKFNITGDPKTVGHKYSWEGKKTGVGSLTLRRIDRKHIHFDLEFIKPFKSSAKDNWLFEEWGNGETKVTWQNNGELPFPVARLMGPIIKKGLDRQFVEGLKNLKNLSENDGEKLN